MNRRQKYGCHICNVVANMAAWQLISKCRSRSLGAGSRISFQVHGAHRTFAGRVAGATLAGHWADIRRGGYCRRSYAVGRSGSRSSSSRRRGRFRLAGSQAPEQGQHCAIGADPQHGAVTAWPLRRQPGRVGASLRCARHRHLWCGPPWCRWRCGLPQPTASRGPPGRCGS